MMLITIHKVNNAHGCDISLLVFYVSDLTVSADGHVHGCLPALPAKYIWRHPVPSAHLGRGHGRSSAGTVYRLHLLLLRKLKPQLRAVLIY